MSPSDAADGPQRPMHITLEFTRTDNASDRYAASGGAHEYICRINGGAAKTAVIDWDTQLADDLVALSANDAQPDVPQCIGNRLKDILASTDWPVHHRRIVEMATSATAGQVVVTILSDADEIYAIPWELVSGDTGQRLDQMPHVLVRYGCRASDRAPSAPESSLAASAMLGRIVLAWSDAHGWVPHEDHRQILTGLGASTASGWGGFDHQRDEIGRVFYSSLKAALAATSARAPANVLHILCHGVHDGDSVGLGFHCDEGSGLDRHIVHADTLRELLAPHARHLRLVVLAACDSGDSGKRGNHLGSVALALHRAGIEAIIAARIQLSTDGATAFANVFYPALLHAAARAPNGKPQSISACVEHAFVQARAAITPGLDRLSWQLFSHSGLVDHTAAGLSPEQGQLGKRSSKGGGKTSQSPRGLRWLHLSDLQAGRDDAALRHALVDELEADIKAMAENEVGPPDVIVFTGNMAYSGKADEYEQVNGLLDRIRGWLAEVHPHAPEPLLFAVPGNHDVVRPQGLRKHMYGFLAEYGEGKTESAKELHRELWKQSPEYVALIAQLFADFSNWQTEYVIEPLRQARQRGDRCREVHASFFPGDLSAIIEIHGVRLALVGLNSAWLQYKSGSHRGKLHMPLEQLHAALPCKIPGDYFKQCNAAFLLQHHPREWLGVRGQAVFDSGIYLANRFSLCLVGHLHNARVETRAHSGSKLRHFFQAPPLFGPAQHVPSPALGVKGYAWGEIFADGSLRIWPRKIVPRGDGSHRFDRDKGLECQAGQEYLWLREPTKPAEPTGAGTTQGTERVAGEADCSHMLPRYAAWARQKYRHLPMLGLGGGEFDLGIDEVYVALKLVPKERIHERDKHAHLAMQRHETIEVEQVLTVAGGERHAFIRGEPGTGKTTALKKLLWTMLDGDGFAGERLGLSADTVPVFLRLRHVAGPRLDIKRRDFGEVLEEELAEAEVPGFGRWLWKRGGLLLLFDGLDEVGDRDARKYACYSLEKLAEQAHERNIRVVVSSRFSGIEDSSGGEVNLGEDYFVHLNVQKMREEQIEQLIGRWYEAAGRARARMRQEDEAAGQVKGQTQAAELYKKLSRKKSAKIKELISTPMLLTLLCLMVERGGKIPERRVDFFSRCLDILLESWMEEWQRERLLDQTQALRLLEPMAWEMHCGNREYEMRKEEMRAIWAPRLRELANQRVRGSDDKPVTFEKVLDWFCSASGVLVEYGKEEYGFMHLSLQEYLAAAYAAHEGKRDEMAEKFAEKRWREVLLLYVGLRDQRTLGPLLEQVISKDSEQDWAKERALVEECLREASERDLGPLRRLAADGERRAPERALALQMAQKYPEEALIELSSELALETTAGAEELRRVAEEIEMRAPWIDSVAEDEQEPDGDVVLVGGQRAEKRVQAWAKRMQEWGWGAEAQGELKAVYEPWREYRMMVIWCGSDGSGVWQELESRRTLVEAVRRRMPMVLWMESEDEGQVPAFLRTMPKVREAELGAKLAEMLGKEAPVGEVARGIELGEPQRGHVHEVEATGTRLLWLPGGRYWMGSGEEDEMADEDEKPRREVPVEGFWLGEMVVTNQEYGALMEKYGLSEPEYWRDRNYNQPEQPVVGVSWQDAVKYCNALSESEGRKACYRIEGAQIDRQSGEGYRLPTEAEWEYACRAGTETRWWFGDEESELEKYAWYDANSEDRLQPVGRKPANPWGLYDMHGNVWEWCWDAWRKNETQKMNAARVVRGGAFVNPARVLRSARRVGVPPGVRVQRSGFRVARGGPRALFT